MASCLTGGGGGGGGGGRAYPRLELQLLTKSSSTTSWTSHSPYSSSSSSSTTSSPSSTVSDSNNSPLGILTRKPRTPRKRPNQTYHEAATLLSTAYPNLFSSSPSSSSAKFNKTPPTPYYSPDLLLPFQFSSLDHISGFFLHPPTPPTTTTTITTPTPHRNKPMSSCRSPGEINTKQNSPELNGELSDDFDAESILDEEIDEEGIDSIIGKLNNDNNNNDDDDGNDQIEANTCYGYPVWMGQAGCFDYALRSNASDHWWSFFPTVNVVDISPRFNAIAVVAEKKKKKKKKVEKIVELKDLDSGKGGSDKCKSSSAQRTKERDEGETTQGEGEEPVAAKPNEALNLKLNYDDVLNTWSDRSSPFPEELRGSSNVQVRLAKIDLFTQNGRLREASVLRYKEKRLTRLFSKKIRYQVRKVNADRRSRMKGRFVRRQHSLEDEQR